MKRIVLAVDGSEHSIRAAQFAGELSMKFDAPVDIVNIVPEGTPVVPGAVHEYAHLEHIVVTQRDLLKAVGSDIVAVATAKVKGEGGHVATQDVVIGSPAHAIVDFAERVGADCVVMGRRGLSDMKGLLIGSVSHRVAHLTDVTLITVE